MRLAKIFFYLVLEVGALFGVHMRPEQIEELMNIHNRTVACDVWRKEDDEPEE